MADDMGTGDAQSGGAGATASHPPNWYPDGYGNLRWWDGTQWTEHLVPGHPLAQPVRPASPKPVVVDTGRRVIAYLIDMALLIPGYMVIAIGFFNAFHDFATFRTEAFPPGFGLYLSGYGIVMATQVINRGIMQGRTGKSLGKHVTKIRVVRIEDGEPSGVWWSLLRLVVEMFAGIIDIVFGFATERRQRVGDLAGKTIVINDEDRERLLAGRTTSA
jgi:uncharacterized RDD family membrane protein YckC